MKSSDCYSVITGASSGLGKALAIELARRKKNLILISLPGTDLDALSHELRRLYGVKTSCYECDLTAPGTLERIAEGIMSTHRVDMLINNAGMGGSMCFEEADISYLDRMIMLNVRTTTLLTRLLLPELKSHDRSQIINIASLAAFTPFPYKTIYPASKSFIRFLSESLSMELSGSGVSVTVAAPGPFMSNPRVSLQIIYQGLAGRLSTLSTGSIARITLKASEKGKAIVVPGLFNKISRFLMCSLPSFIAKPLIGMIIKRELKYDLNI